MKLKYWASSLFLASAMVANADSILIDDFNHGAPVAIAQRDGAGYTDQTVTGDGSLDGVINGYRTLEAALDAGSDGSSTIQCFGYNHKLFF